MAEETEGEKFPKETSNNSNNKLEYNNARLISVEFPGVVNNPAHLVQCLGGEGELNNVFCNNTRRLGMTFRPDDPYSKIVCGDRFPSTSLLLRVRRRKKKGNSAEGGEVKEGHEYKQEILGVVDTTYRFNSLADYQYLSRDVDYPLTQVQGLEVLQDKVPRHLFPPTFSRYEKPVNYLFIPDLQPPKVSQVDLEDEDARKKASKMRKRQSVYALAVSFQTKDIPHKPHDKAAEGVAFTQDNQLEVIQKLFNIRPIWSRMALHAHMNVNKTRMDQLLSYVAYYCLNGPWRTLWVKIGYDPRKDPNAKILKKLQPNISKVNKTLFYINRYQLIDYRIGARTVGRNVPIPKKRAHRHNLPVLRKPAPGLTTVDLGRGQTQDDKTEDKQDDDLPYVFTSNKLPVNKQVFYQLCDLHIAEVQELITANDGQENDCHDKEGWVIPGTLDKIRDILVQQTLSYVESVKKDQQTEKDSETSSTIPWEQHEEVKGYLDMLEGDDDVETYDVFGNDSDDDNNDDDDIITTEVK